MLIRIVKMDFNPHYIEAFKSYFETIASTIRAFEGNQRLELYQDLKHPSVFFTYSYWESEEALEVYRQSDFFKTVWKTTKANFQAPAEAWSVNPLHRIV